MSVGHDLPPCCAGSKTFLSRTLSPPPHDAEQSLKFDHSPTIHATIERSASLVASASYQGSPRHHRAESRAVIHIRPHQMLAAPKQSSLGKPWSLHHKIWYTRKTQTIPRAHSPLIEALDIDAYKTFLTWARHIQALCGIYHWTTGFSITDAFYENFSRACFKTRTA